MRIVIKVGTSTLTHSTGRMNIRRVEQLRRYSPELLEQRFGKWGRELHARARGIDPRPVVPEHEAKSESAETTFARDTRDREFLKTMLLGHAERVGASLRRHGLRGRTVTLKIKFADFRQITRSRTLPDATDSTETIYETGTALLEAQALPQPVRLIGLGVSGFGSAPTQELLPGVFRGVQGRDPEREARRRRLDAALDSLRDRFGKQAVQRGRLFRPREDGEDD